MSRTNASMARPILLGAILLLTVGAISSMAGEHHFRRARRPAVVQPVPTVRRIDPVYGDRLGTFFPTPAVVVQGNYPAGGGYSPLGTFGDTTMSLYGPLSSFRTTTAPVLTYTRGYDGVVRPAELISTSYPNLPLLAPLAYPTRANYYYAPRILDNPGQESAINWLDQN
jgi:hypothetical protein